MQNVVEFIAEAFSNPQFQQVLRLAKAPRTGGKIRSAWDSFVNLVRRILGLQERMHDALSEALSVGARLMQENVASDDRPSLVMGSRAQVQSNADDELSALERTMRYARGSNHAKALMKEVVGKPIENIETGITATVSGMSFGKMMSKSAVDRSESPAAHYQALANIDKLFRLATLRESRPDRSGKESLRAIHHFEVPMPFDGDVLRVKIMAKEFAHDDQGTRLYLVQAVEIENAGVKGGDPEVSGQFRRDRSTASSPPPGVADRFSQMVAAVKSGLPGGTQDDANVLGNIEATDDLRTRATNAASDILTSAESFNWLNRTINTQYHKAQKDPEHFGRVFEMGQKFIETISRTASRPAPAQSMPRRRRFSPIPRSRCHRQQSRPSSQQPPQPQPRRT